MATNNSKVFITDVFVKGAINGWNLITHSTIPNVLMAFVIIKILNISGLLAIIGKVFSPIMMIFGLPGEAGYCHFVPCHCSHGLSGSVHGTVLGRYRNKR